MSLQFTTRMFILAVSMVGLTAASTIAQESDGKLKSVLLNDDDLRPLIDLNAPDPPEPKSSSTDKTLTDNQSEPDPISTGQADVEATENERTVSIIPGLEPIPDTFQAEATPKPLTQARRVSADPLFDLGISTMAASTGPRIRGVFVDSPAQFSGLKPGDTVTEINGTNVATSAELANLLATQISAANSISISVIRNGSKIPITVDMQATVGRLVGTATTTGRSDLRRGIPAQTVSTQPTQPRSPVTAPQTVVSPQPYQVVYPAQPQPQFVGDQFPIARQPILRQQVQPRAAAPRARNGPLIGDGGRLIGNGRLINSTRRLFGIR